MKKIKKNGKDGNISTINTSGTCDNIPQSLEPIKETQSQVFERWDKLNLTEGLKGHINENIQKLYECESKHILTPNENEILSKNDIIINLLTKISDQLNFMSNAIIDLDNKKVDKKNLSDMDLAELTLIRRLSNDIIEFNRYPGGDRIISQTASNLKNRLDIEINNRIVNL